MKDDQTDDIEAREDDEIISSKRATKPKMSYRERTLFFIESTPVTAFMTMVTFYALYSDDIRVLAFNKSADGLFVIFSTGAFFLFLLEIGVQCWCRDNYVKIPKWQRRSHVCAGGYNWSYCCNVFKAFVFIGSFYFWLDLLATFSMVFELPWINSYSEGGVDGNLENARAGKASRAGAKAARILKVVRMIRLVRLVKLYKYFTENQQKQGGSGSIAPDNEGNEFEKLPPESHVGAEMSDRTTKKVIIGILIMLVVIPLLQVQELEYLNEFGMHMVLKQRASIDIDRFGGISIENWERAEGVFIDTTSCIDMTYSGFDDDLRNKALIPLDRADAASLRKNEMLAITINDDIYSLVATFDVSRRADEEAMLGVLLTSFVILLLAVGTMTFSRDVNSLVIIPIEKMVQLVREISANPLGKNFSLSPDELKGADDGMETTVLLRTISKIAGLMRIGFGEAGAEIIGKNLNMSSDDNGGSSMNLLGNGTKILSIFGFVDVRNFTDTTECLQEEVMLFVNRIAHILHSIVVQCDGAANKNIGDAFLLTWKINPANIDSCEHHNYAGDKALYSLLKTMVEMIRYEDFICNFSPTSLGALYERMPGYKCRIGCGLHFGWAVEGAIGSDKKIDASYISPHVNWAEFLESSTKAYGVPILLSEPFFNLLSPSVSKYCRQVDNIKKSSHDDVIALYTYDANLDVEMKKVNIPGVESISLRKQNFRASRLRKTTLITLDSGRSSDFRHSSEDNSMVRMQNPKRYTNYNDCFESRPTFTHLCFYQYRGHIHPEQRDRELFEIQHRDH